MGPKDYLLTAKRYSKIFDSRVLSIIQKGDYDFNSSGIDVPCYFLGSDSYLPMIFSCMYSLRYNGKLKFRFCIIEDPRGFSEEVVNMCPKFFKSVTIVRKQEI